MIKKSRMPSATAGSSWLIIFRLAMEKQNFSKKIQFSVGVLQNSCTHIQGGFFNWASPENVSRLAPSKPSSMRFTKHLDFFRSLGGASLGL